MRLFFLLALGSGIISCSGPGTSDDQLSGADSIVINFNAPQSTAIVNTIQTTETNAIKKFKQFTEGKKADEYKCGYNGNLQFYAKGVMLGDFSFNYSEDCRHFIQLKEDKLSSTVMSKEAAEFLKSLAEGKD
jgi:hypothetical protein